MSKIDENEFLEKWKKVLGVEVDLSEIEQKHARKRKEAALLEGLNKTLERLTNKEVEEVEVAFKEPIAVIEEPKVLEVIAEVHEEPVIEEVIEPLEEQGKQPEPELPKDDIVNKNVVKLSKAPQKDIQKVADTIPDSLRKELDILKKSVADMHRFAQRHSQMGGGGEVNLRYLDDINRASISDGLYLRYDAATKKFMFDTPAGGTGPGGTGATGATGPAGLDGATGATGPSGLVGATGLTGATGPAGTNGTIGVDGATGVQGSTGSTGATGIVGPTGIQGATGLTGVAGSTGATGLPGDRYASASTSTWTIDTQNNQQTAGTIYIGTGLSWTIGQSAIIATNGVHQHVTVTAYNPATGQFDFYTTGHSGSGTFSSWVVNLDGAVGAQGATGIGATGASGLTGATGAGTTGATGLTGATGAGGSQGYYGSFYDSLTQTATNINTAAPVLVRNNDISFGVSVNNSSRVTVTSPGIYNFQFSIQLHNTGGGGSGQNAIIWLSKNGTSLPDTATDVTVNTNSPYVVAAWNFVVSLNANDYLELMWYVDNTSIVISSNPIVSPAPAIPSVIITLTQVLYTQLGPSGATGPAGATGLSGATGLTGSVGATGLMGATGIGIIGATGLQGITGATGLIGATGIQGATGLTGATGPASSLTPSNYIVQGKLNVDQTITGGSDNIIQFIDDFDPQNWWNASTYRFTPTVAGYYEIKLAVWWNSATTNSGQNNIQARKGGNNTFMILQWERTNVNGRSVTGSKIVYLNGTTDFVDFSAYSDVTQGIQKGTVDGSGSWFSATLIAYGLPGATGITGATGVGATGASGQSGATGATGVTGAAGSSGATGATGPMPALTYVTRTAIGNASTVNYTVTSGCSVHDVLVFLDGICQEPTTDYTISTTTLTFTTAPYSGAKIVIRELPH